MKFQKISIHTHPIGGHWKFWGGGGGWGISNAIIFKGEYEAKLEISERWGGEVVKQKTFHGEGYKYFLEQDNWHLMNANFVRIYLE